jgi:hypothetical protein
MVAMEIQRVDPRTTQWEVHRPIYRVYFWAASNASDEYELRGAANFNDVIAWANANRGDRTYTAYAVVPASDGSLGLVRVYGTDPTRAN